MENISLFLNSNLFVLPNTALLSIIAGIKDRSALFRYRLFIALFAFLQSRDLFAPKEENLAFTTVGSNVLSCQDVHDHEKYDICNQNAKVSV